VQRAVELARICQPKHPDTDWLCSLFPVSPEPFPHLGIVLHRIEGDHPDDNNWRYSDDARAIYFGQMLRSAKSLGAMKKAAQLGYPRAQTWMVCVGDDEHLQSAVAANCPEAFYCSYEKFRTVGALQRAAELGWVEAQYWWGLQFCDLKRRWIIWAKSMVYAPYWFNARDAINVTTTRAEIYIAINSQLRWDNRWFIFTIASHAELLDLPERSPLLQKCIVRARVLLDEARVEMMAWVVCAKRMGVSRDMRMMVSRMIWEEKTQINMCDI